MNKKSINYQHIMPIRDVWQNYKSEVVFGVILSMLVVFSYRVAAFIPEDFFENVINPIENTLTITVCFFGGWIMRRHAEGDRLRLSWARMLWLWGVLTVVLMVLRYGFLFYIRDSLIGHTNQYKISQPLH